MKVGGAEGTPQELTDFFQNNGLNPGDYFQRVESSTATRWVVIPAVLVLASVFALWWLATEHAQYQWLAFLLGVLAVIWLTASLQLRYKQVVVTGIAGFSALSVMVVAFGLLTPLEALEQLRQLLPKRGP